MPKPMDSEGRLSMKVLLAGGAGYIGSYVLVQCREAGHGVVLLDNFSKSSPKAIAGVEALTVCRVPLHEGDVRDAGLLDRILTGSGSRR